MSVGTKATEKKFPKIFSKEERGCFVLSIANIVPIIPHNLLCKRLWLSELIIRVVCTVLYCIVTLNSVIMKVDCTILFCTVSIKKCNNEGCKGICQ